MSKFENLLSPIQIGQVTLKNRIVKAPQSTMMWDPDGMINQRVFDVYEGLAKGGAAMIVMGAIIFTPSRSPLAFGGVYDDKQIPGLTNLTETVHKYGCRILPQLHHAGPAEYLPGGGVRQASTTFSSEETPLDYRFPTHGVTIEEIEVIKQQYIDAADRAKRAGFDGVECHSAHGYFLLSFLSRIWNHRTDQYGPQNMENRTRLQREIVAGIRERCGQDFIIGMRLNGQEFGHPEAMTPPEAAEAGKLFEAGGVDYLNVVGYGYGVPPMQYVPDYFPYPEPDDFMKEAAKRLKSGLWMKGAEAVKKVVNIPVVAVGRLNEELGEEYIKQGKADMLFLGRQLWADPELPNKVLEGRPEDIVRCCRCGTCEDPYEDPVRCRVNPALGWESKLAILPAATKKKVLVVGGGPAGMEAARVAAIRGHDVTLCEKNSYLGGKLPLAAMIKGTELDDVTTVSKWLAEQVDKLPVAVKTDTEVDEAYVASMKPDVVILAVGGVYGVPEDLPGIKGSNVQSVVSLAKVAEAPLKLFGAKAVNKLSTVALPGVKKNVVILGGQIEGLQGAVFLKKRGKNVTVIEEADTTGNRFPPRYLARTYPWLERQGVKVITGVHYDEVTKDGVKITTKDGKRELIPADTVMVLMPPLANEKLKNSISGKVPELFTIGCCNGVEQSLVVHALKQAREIGCQI